MKKDLSKPVAFAIIAVVALVAVGIAYFASGGGGTDFNANTDDAVSTDYQLPPMSEEEMARGPQPVDLR